LSSTGLFLLKISLGGGFMGMKSAREKSGLTVLQVSLKFGISPVAVYKWENGKNYPAADKLQELAKMYGCTVDELLKGNGKVE